MARHETAEQRTMMPTPLRLEEARRRGQVARSADLTSAALLLAAFGTLALLGPELLKESVHLVARLLGAAGGAIVPAELWPAVGSLGATVLLLCLVLMAVAVAAGALQVGLRLTTASVRPDAARLGAAQGLRRIVSRRTVVRLAFLLAKIAAVTIVGGATIREMLPDLPRWVSLDGWGLAMAAGSLVWKLALRAGVALLALAVLDYLYQRWQHRQDLKMTRREYLEDLKRMEGDPLIRRRRLAAGRPVSARRLADAMAQADVVLAAGPRGPVAVLGIRGSGTPRLLCAGRDNLAGRILARARQHHVRVIEDADLAKQLCRRTRVGADVPRALYEPLAQRMAQAEAKETHG